MCRPEKNHELARAIIGAVDDVEGSLRFGSLCLSRDQRHALAGRLERVSQLLRLDLPEPCFPPPPEDGPDAMEFVPPDVPVYGIDESCET